MAITVTEKYANRRNSVGLNPFVDINYIIQGTSDEFAARTALYNDTSGSYLGLGRETVEVWPHESENTWNGQTHYGYMGQDGDLLYQFETTGGTQHITHSLGTQRSYSPNTNVAPKFNGAINVTGDAITGTVAGCDIVAPVYQWSETHYFVAATVTPVFRGNLFSLTGKVNLAPFGDGLAGEVLFLGASGTRRGGPNGPDWLITYRFAASPNATVANAMLIMQGFGSGPIVKDGWDYLWVHYSSQPDATSKSTTLQPDGALHRTGLPARRFFAPGHPHRGLFTMSQNGEPFAKVTPGMPFSPSAARHNATVDAATRLPCAQLSGGAGKGLPTLSQTTVVRVQNQTGGDLATHAIVALGNSYFGTMDQGWQESTPLLAATVPLRRQHQDDRRAAGPHPQRHDRPGDDQRVRQVLRGLGVTPRHGQPRPDSHPGGHERHRGPGGEQDALRGQRDHVSGFVDRDGGVGGVSRGAFIGSGRVLPRAAQQRHGQQRQPDDGGYLHLHAEGHHRRHDARREQGQRR